MSDFAQRRAQMVEHQLRERGITDERVLEAMGEVPREAFVPERRRELAYSDAALPIGSEQTISQPWIVAAILQALELQGEEKVLEIGTGSGVQSAYIANLTENAYTIEIIKPLADRTRGVYDRLIDKGYTEYKHVKTKTADGYYGWEEAGPFDKIIVTCGIDHVPPPLLQQLKAGGLMVIPVGPPGAQRVLKVAKTQGADGSITTSREDIYGGKIVPFVPFTKLEGDQVVGTHNR
jgi:protein-L-isoaspartate(D-aspartate) O-methyltransferase